MVIVPRPTWHILHFIQSAGIGRSQRWYADEYVLASNWNSCLKSYHPLNCDSSISPTIRIRHLSSWSRRRLHWTRYISVVWLVSTNTINENDQSIFFKWKEKDTHSEIIPRSYFLWPIFSIQFQHFYTFIRRRAGSSFSICLYVHLITVAREKERKTNHYTSISWWHWSISMWFVSSNGKFIYNRSDYGNFSVSNVHTSALMQRKD